MRTILMFVGGIVLANIVWATFFWHAPPAKAAKPQPVVNSATKQGQDPWMANERYNAHGRDIARKSVLETLGKPWSTFCSAEGRKSLISSINYYYGQRDAQVSSYANTYGEAAKQFAIHSWKTPDDNRIERLMREHFGRGYYTLAELRSNVRTAVSELTKGERVTAKPCAG
jgi:hypothetical protein